MTLNSSYDFLDLTYYLSYSISPRWQNYQNAFFPLMFFRGMTICFMIIVNTPGSGATPFAPLEHAGWHGFTPTDSYFHLFYLQWGMP
jgi:hypothetical protein